MSRRWGRGWDRPRVRNRRDDRLARLDPLEFERVVADYYRRQGYTVEHCGTGGGGRRFDGGIDLKMHRDGEYTIVQCKRENALQVTHNVGHELLGILMTERADRAIVVNAGEFTPHALATAAKNPQLELIDGDRLRGMLGSLLDGLPEPEPEWIPVSASAARRAPHHVLSAPARRHPGGSIDYGRRANKRDEMDGVAKVVTAAVLLLLVLAWRCSGPSPTQRTSQNKPPPAHVKRQSEPVLPPAIERPAAIPPAPVQQPPRAPQYPTEAQIRESQRKADEAMRVLAPNTPEF
ncbi:MAG: restriction endonuclease [Lysobacter sp.]